MDKTLIVKDIIKIDNKILVKYDQGKCWNKFLNDNEMWYSYDKNIESVPDSIAIIPFLCNILPISWVFDLKISIDSIDEKFYSIIENIKNGYKKMYPTMDFKGTLQIKGEKIKNDISCNKACVMYSGGVDAVCTLYRHLDEKPDLITIFGTDISLEDAEGIQTVNEQHSKIANEMGLKYERIFSNLKYVCNHYNLTSYLSQLMFGEWWHDMQSGIGMIGLLAPLSYLNGYETVYIASSFCEKQKGSYTCASDPVIDNEFKYCNTITYHDGYELSRQEKIKFICETRKKRNIEAVNLRVCWKSTGGKNCCECEKCYRTILGIIAEKEEPNNYYFNLTNSKKIKMIKYLKKTLEYKSAFRYIPIHEAFLANYSLEDTPKEFMWLRNIKICSKDEKFTHLIKKLKRAIKNIIRKVIS